MQLTPNQKIIIAIAVFVSVLLVYAYVDRTSAEKEVSKQAEEYVKFETNNQTGDTDNV